jgi:hypothetical protein
MIGGTAYVAGRAGQRSAQRSQDEADREQYQEQRIAELEAQNQAAAPAPAAAPSNDMVSRLGELSKLHSSGALTDEEFAAAKQQLIGS